jgi:hypothetical protein
MTKARKKKTPRSLADLSTLDDFLNEEGKFEEFQSIAINEVLAWQAAQSVKANNISCRRLATDRRSTPERESFSEPHIQPSS